MKTGLSLLLACIIKFNLVSAQSLRYPIAQPYINLSAYSSQQSDALSFTGNQAALAQAKSTGVGIYG